MKTRLLCIFGILLSLTAFSFALPYSTDFTGPAYDSLGNVVTTNVSYGYDYSDSLYATKALTGLGNYSVNFTLNTSQMDNGSAVLTCKFGTNVSLLVGNLSEQFYNASASAWQTVCSNMSTTFSNGGFVNYDCNVTNQTNFTGSTSYRCLVVTLAAASSKLRYDYTGVRGSWDRNVDYCGSICEPGNYTLIANLTDTTGRACISTCSDQNWDCRGYTISGNGAGTGMLLDGSNLNASNCRIQNFTTGIDDFKSSNFRNTNNTIYNVVNGITGLGGGITDAYFIGNNITSNQSCLNVQYSSGVFDLENNTCLQVHDTGVNAIYLSDTINNGIIRGNNVSGEGNCFFQFENYNNLLEGNNLNCVVNGFYATFASNNTYRNNTCTVADGSCFYYSSSDMNGNFIYDNHFNSGFPIVHDEADVGYPNYYNYTVGGACHGNYYAGVGGLNIYDSHVPPTGYADIGSGLPLTAANFGGIIVSPSNTFIDYCPITSKTSSVLRTAYQHGMDFGSLPNATELLNASETYHFNIYGLVQKFSGFAANLSTLQATLSQAHNSGILTYTRIIFDGNYSNSSTYMNDTVAYINANLTFYTNTTYLVPTVYIVMVLNESDPNVVTFANNVSKALWNATGNYVTIYACGSGADSSYCVYNSTDGAYYDPFNKNFFRSGNTMTSVTAIKNILRTFANSTTGFIVSSTFPTAAIAAADLHTNTIEMLRADPFPGDAPTNANATSLLNGDVVVCNAVSTPVNNSITVSGRNGKYVWDSSRKRQIEPNTDGTFVVEVNGYNCSNVFIDYFSKIVLPANYPASAAPLFTGGVTYNASFNYTNDSALVDVFEITGNNRLQTTLWNPNYARNTEGFITYDWLNASAESNVSFATNSRFLAIADKNKAEINASWKGSGANNSYYCGYVPLGGPCSDNAVYIANKTQMAEDWLQNYSIGCVFFDQPDTGALNCGNNFTANLQAIRNNVKAAYPTAYLIGNDYTTYQGIGNFFDAESKESFCSRWGNTTENPTYSWENISLDEARINYQNTQDRAMTLIAFGPQSNASLLQYCHAEKQVLCPSCSFVYAIPTFQQLTAHYFPDFGFATADEYTTAPDGTRCRQYSKGIVCINPNTYNWTFSSGIQITNFTLRLKLYKPACNNGCAPINVSINGQTNSSWNFLPTDIASQYTGTWVQKDIIGAYTADGRYNITFYPGNASAGIDIYKDNNPWQGTHSSYSTNGGSTWVPYGRSGAFNDTVTANLKAGLYLEWTQVNAVDTTSALARNQSYANGGANKTYSVNVSNSESINLSVWDAGITLAGANFSLYAINSTGGRVKLNVTNSSTCELSTNTVYNTSTVQGLSWLACFNNATKYLRVAFPHLSPMGYELDLGDTAPVCGNLTYSNLNPVQIECVYALTNCSDADGDNITISGNWSVGGTLDPLANFSALYSLNGTANTTLRINYSHPNSTCPVPLQIGKQYNASAYANSSSVNVSIAQNGGPIPVPSPQLNPSLLALAAITVIGGGAAAYTIYRQNRR